MNSKKIALYGVVAALYVVLTVIIAPLSYGPLQFRVSEILVTLIMFDLGFSWPILIGTALANFFSPLGMIDVIFGTVATLVAIGSYVACKKVLPSDKFWQQAIYFVVTFGMVGMFLIAIELNIVEQLPLFETWITVMIGQVAVLVLGVLLMKKIYPRFVK
ncbi:MAG: QueT transporter family protein [Culicoidibacterales bacterium]